MFDVLKDLLGQCTLTATLMGKYVLLFDFDPTVIPLVADLNESFSAVFPSLRTDDLSELLIAANAGYSYQ